MGPSDQVAFDALSPEQLAWIETLEPTKTVFGDVFLCHGTPQSDSTYWLERVQPDGTARRNTGRGFDRGRGDHRKFDPVRAPAYSANSAIARWANNRKSG